MDNNDVEETLTIFDNFSKFDFNLEMKVKQLFDASIALDVPRGHVASDASSFKSIKIVGKTEINVRKAKNYLTAIFDMSSPCEIFEYDVNHEDVFLRSLGDIERISTAHLINSDGCLIVIGANESIIVRAISLFTKITEDLIRNGLNRSSNIANLIDCDNTIVLDEVDENNLDQSFAHSDDSVIFLHDSTNQDVMMDVSSDDEEINDIEQSVEIMDIDDNGLHDSQECILVEDSCLKINEGKEENLQLDVVKKKRKRKKKSLKLVVLSDRNEDRINNTHCLAASMSETSNQNSLHNQVFNNNNRTNYVLTNTTVNHFYSVCQEQMPNNVRSGLKNPVLNENNTINLCTEAATNCKKQINCSSETDVNAPNQLLSYCPVKNAGNASIRLPSSSKSAASTSSDMDRFIDAASSWYKTRDCNSVASIRNNSTSTRLLRPIVIDGSNVAMHHGLSKVFSCRGIQLVIDYFRGRGHVKIVTFVPQWRRASSASGNVIRDIAILEQLYKEALLVFTPSRRVDKVYISSYDDRFILKYASEEGAIVVSNDHFKDLYSEPVFKETIEKRILPFTFIGDKVMFPDDPLGRAGPTLDDFLTFSNGPVTSAQHPYRSNSASGFVNSNNHNSTWRCPPSSYQHQRQQVACFSDRFPPPPTQQFYSRYPCNTGEHYYGPTIPNLKLPFIKRPDTVTEILKKKILSCRGGMGKEIDLLLQQNPSISNVDYFIRKLDLLKHGNR